MANPYGFPSCGLSLPTPGRSYDSDIEDSPDLPASVLPLSSGRRDISSYLTPAPLLGPTQTRRQLAMAQDPRQEAFGTWNPGLGIQEVRIYSPPLPFHSSTDCIEPSQPHGSRAPQTSQQLSVARLDHNTLFTQNQLYRDLASENIRLQSQLEYSK
jgi:hypothetical protein